MLHQSSTMATSSSMSNGMSEITVSSQQQPLQNFSDKICFNFGKELYVYSYRGLKKVNIFPDGLISNSSINECYHFNCNGINSVTLFAQRISETENIKS